MGMERIEASLEREMMFDAVFLVMSCEAVLFIDAIVNAKFSYILAFINFCSPWGTFCCAFEVICFAHNISVLLCFMHIMHTSAPKLRGATTLCEEYKVNPSSCRFKPLYMLCGSYFTFQRF